MLLVAVLVGEAVVIGAVDVGAAVDGAGDVAPSTGAHTDDAVACAAAAAARAVDTALCEPPEPPEPFEPPELPVDVPLLVLVRLALEPAVLELLELAVDAVAVSVDRVARAWSRMACASRTAWFNGTVSIVASG